MAGRIRTIKPEILEDAVTAGLSDMAFRLFIACITLADDHGRLRAEPGWLMGQVYWARTVQVDAFLKAWKELTGPPKEGSEPLVRAYVVNGQKYAEIRNWTKHQKVSHPGRPRIPQPGKVLGDPPESLPRSSGESPETLGNDLRPPITDHIPPTTDQSAAESAEGVAPEGRPKPADDVWSAYVAALARHRPRRRPGGLSPKDRKRIAELLKQGFSVDDLTRAIRGLFVSPFHLGQNDRSTEYLALEYALRKPGDMAALADAAEPPPRPANPSPPAEGFVDPAVIAEFERRMFGDGDQGAA